ncbi:unnamed protein product [Malus baccata var. baccata]
MTDEEALKLLTWHAFGIHCPDKEYIELATDVVDYCGGLPLALKVVGRLLATKKSKSIWKSTLDKLRNIPHGKIHETLRLSYDGLSDDHVKCVFLDISHFFINWIGTDVVAILDSCSRFCVESEIRTLQDRCLLDFDSPKFRMHDLIRDMGREIVRAECAMKPGKRSRLWHHEDVTSVLRDESLPKKLKFLILEHSRNLTQLPDFSKLPHLEILSLNDCKNLPTSLYGLEANYCTELEIMPDLPEMSKMIQLQPQDCRKLKDIPNLDNFICDMYTCRIFYCTGSLRIHVVNRTQRTRFHIWPMKTTVTASHECYLWLGNLTNKKLNLKGGDKVRVHADFIETEDDHQIKVKKTGVDIIEWEYEYEDMIEEENYQTAPYESDKEDTDDDTELSDYSSDEVQPFKRVRLFDLNIEGFDDEEETTGN